MHMRQEPESSADLYNFPRGQPFCSIASLQPFYNTRSWFFTVFFMNTSPIVKTIVEVPPTNID
jgi:hypothetical protein